MLIFVGKFFSNLFLEKLEILPIIHPFSKKHEPSKMNYYIFRDEVTPLGVNSLYSS